MQDDEIDLAIPAWRVQCVLWFTVFTCNLRFVAQEMCSPRVINLYHTLLSMIYDSTHAIMAFQLGVYATSRKISTRILQPACKIYSCMTIPGCFGCWSTRPRVSQPRTKTLLYGTRSKYRQCVWAWLVKVQSSVARAHAPGFAACSTCSDQERHNQMSAAVTSSQLRMLAQYQGGTCSLVG